MARARSNRHVRAAKLTGKCPRVYTELLGDHLEGQALAVSARRLCNCPVGHLTDYAPPGDVPTIEVGDHRGAVDVE